MERLLYRVEEAGNLLSLSRSKVYDLMAKGELECVKIGRSIRITREELTRFAERLTPAPTAGKNR